MIVVAAGTATAGGGGVLAQRFYCLKRQGPSQALERCFLTRIIAVLAIQSQKHPVGIFGRVKRKTGPIGTHSVVVVVV